MRLHRGSRRPGSFVPKPVLTVILPAKDVAPFPGTTRETLLRPFDGLADARNEILAAVEGKSFCFLYGDDWLQPGRLPALHGAVHYLGADVLRTDHVMVNGSERTLARANWFLAAGNSGRTSPRLRRDSGNTPERSPARAWGQNENESTADGSNLTR